MSGSLETKKDNSKGQKNKNGMIRNGGRWTDSKQGGCCQAVWKVVAIAEFALLLRFTSTSPPSIVLITNRPPPQHTFPVTSHRYFQSRAILIDNSANSQSSFSTDFHPNTFPPPRTRNGRHPQHNRQLQAARLCDRLDRAFPQGNDQEVNQGQSQHQQAARKDWRWCQEDNHQESACEEGVRQE